MSTVDQMDTLNSELYRALLRRQTAKVIQLVQQAPDGPFHVLTVHEDTVLHMAAYTKQKALVMDLVKRADARQPEKWLRTNKMGYTVLHEVATAGHFVDIVDLILQKAPGELLYMRNEKDETAIFQAARYGKNEMFRFLDGEFLKKGHLHQGLETFYVRGDKATILHMSVTADHFDLGLQIAQRYENLVPKLDTDGMTALQLLSCKPTAFDGENKYRWFQKFIYKRLSTNLPAIEEGKKRWIVPLFESIRKQKEIYESAVRLAAFLVAREMSWKETWKASNLLEGKYHKYVKAEFSNQPESTRITETLETPLIMATKSGCLEIVREILKVYPQAIEYVDDDGRNILLVAIKYHQVKILDLLEEEMELAMRRLKRKIDNKGNSILHMVAVKSQGHVPDRRNPVLQLQEKLLLFERVKRLCLSDYVELRNNKKQTAEQLFDETNSSLLIEAKDWIKRTSENCSLVAVLIATVAFAAAYTIPGGPEEKTGLPVLLNNPFFLLFTTADVLSITAALASVITFLAILTSPYQYTNFKNELPSKLTIGLTFLMLSVTMLMVAFAATIVLTIALKREWSRIALYSLAFFPVIIFISSYIGLYKSLWESVVRSLKMVTGLIPRWRSEDRGHEKRRVASSYSFEFDERSAFIA